MGRGLGKVAVAAGVAAGASAALRAATGRQDRSEPRWLAVTINAPVDRVAPGGEPPAPLAELADFVEWRVQPAPGGRGTELGARVREAPPGGPAGIASRVAGTDPRQRLREALRHSRQLVETGQVLRPDAPGTTSPGPAGKVVALASRRAEREGLR